MEYTVTTRSGKIMGHESEGLLRFLGIPFAKAPIGKLRYKRAVPVDAWEGVFDAKEYGPAAPQDNHQAFLGEEDNCLTLNVIRSLPESEEISREKKPVYVWIHGGGYNIGSGSDPMSRGDAFARKDIIYVNFQYRLNVWGFYDFTLLPGCEDFESNRGLSDMIVALQWIHENIEAFGGDPDRITIGGESAGGAAVMTLMAVPAVRGCFSQVAAQSGLVNCVMTKEMNNKICELFVQGMGWTMEDLGLLRTEKMLDLVHGHNYVEKVLQYTYPGALEACPVIDDLLPERPLEAIAKGSAAGVKLIIGTNLHEGTMFVRPEDTTFPANWPMVREMFKSQGHADAFSRVKEYYSRLEFSESFNSPFVQLATDYAFVMPSTKAAIAQSRYADTRMYRYEYVNGMGKAIGWGAAHAFEIPAVFGNDNPMFWEHEPEGARESLFAGMHDNWVRFIKGEELPDWPLYQDAGSSVMIFDQVCGPQILDRTEMLNLWGNMRFYEE